MRHYCILLLFTLCLGASAAKVSKSIDITVNGEQRTYWLYVPGSAKNKAPVVFALHGAGGHSTDHSPNFDTIADSNGCIVVYPQGKDIYFPVFGGTVPGWDASGEENADVHFIKAIIEDVAASYSIDRTRLYCCGFSNGGMMTYALTNTCSDVFAAFASISGFPLNEFHFRHTGARPVPFLHIHGKKDDFVRYALMPTIVDEFVARLGANPVPVKNSVRGKYDKSVYEAGEGTFPYTYYEIDNMGHNDFTADIENSSSSITMWKFFRQYTLDTPCDTSLIWRPRLETEGFVPKQHGWTENSSTSLLVFGREQNTSTNQNVYHSLQLTSGNYKLVFRSESETQTTIKVRLQKLTDKKNLLINQTVQAGGQTTLVFKVEDGWGEYRLSLIRESSSMNITVSDLALYRATDQEEGNTQGDPNFHIYLCFGQSNMEGNAKAESIDAQVDTRFRMLATCNFDNPARTLGKWYPARAPIVSPAGGLGPSDYFGRTLVAALPKDVRVGVVAVAMGGSPIEMFDKDKYEQKLAENPNEWWAILARQHYGGNPYQRLVDMARKAQEDGVIKGILLHQGCSNNGDPDWPTMVKKIYNDLLADLGLQAEDVPLFVGETLRQDQGGACWYHNTVVARMPKTVPTSHIVSSEGCPGNGTDPWHFSAMGYRMMGYRYAFQALKLMNLPLRAHEDYRLPTSLKQLFTVRELTLDVDSTLTLKKGRSRRISVNATYLDGHQENVTDSAHLYGPDFITINGNLIKATGEGYGQVTVSYTDFTGNTTEATFNITTGSETGINDLPATPTPLICDLSGQRVLQPRRGPYIIKGRKVLVK